MKDHLVSGYLWQRNRLSRDGWYRAITCRMPTSKPHFCLWPRLSFAIDSVAHGQLSFAMISSSDR